MTRGSQSTVCLLPTKKHFWDTEPTIGRNYRAQFSELAHDSDADAFTYIDKPIHISDYANKAIIELKLSNHSGVSPELMIRDSDRISGMFCINTEGMALFEYGGSSWINLGPCQ